MAGLMPGWQRDQRWTLSNKIYISPGEDVDREPLSSIPEEELHKYEVKFNKVINLYVSPGDAIEITRTLKDNIYKETRAIPFNNQIDGGLDEWIEEITQDLCDANWSRTNFEVGGGFIKGDNPCEIEIIYKKYTPPKPRIPADVMGNIEVILRQIKENADNIDYIQELNRELDIILSRNNLTRKDIEDML